MNAGTSKILEAYRKMNTPSHKKVIVEAEDTKEDENDDDEVEDAPKDEPKPVVKPEEKKTKEDVVAAAMKSGRASKPGTYMEFTGNIRTPGVYGTVEKATFTINDDNTVSWSKGTWIDGTWSGRSSTWNGGTWKNGTWKAGLWTGGTWENGLHTGGIFMGGVWKNGTWDFGVFDSRTLSKVEKDRGLKPTTWEDGIWKGGDWEKGAVWVKGRDSKGNEHTDAPFHWGGMKYSDVTGKKNDDRERSARYSEVFTKGRDDRELDTFDDDANKNHITKAIERAHGKVEVSESVKRHLKGSRILGSMIVEEGDYDAKQQAALEKIRAEIVDEDNTNTNVDKPADTDTKEPTENVDEAKKKLTKEELEKIELNDEICMSLEDASVEDLRAVKQFIDDGFKCVPAEDEDNA